MLITDMWETEIPKEYYLLGTTVLRAEVGESLPGPLLLCPFSPKLAFHIVQIREELPVRQSCAASPRQPEREYMCL